MSIDKAFHKKKAAGFVNRGDCYIHTEMKDGKTPETLIAGDMQAVLWGILAELTRWSELCQCNMNDAFGMLAALHHYGAEGMAETDNGRNVNKNRPVRVIDGQDWQEEWIADKEASYEKQWQKKVRKYENKVKDFESRLQSAEALTKNVKMNYETQIKKLKADKESMQKEIDALEHRLTEMQNHCLIEPEEES